MLEEIPDEEGEEGESIVGMYKLKHSKKSKLKKGIKVSMKSLQEEEEE